MDDQFELLLRHFKQYINVSNGLEKELRNNLHFKSFKKGELIHDCDKICTHSFFIVNGLVRTFYVKDGVEISEYFSSELEWINSPKSFIGRVKDIYSIDCLEKTEVYSIYVEDLVHLFNHYPEMERYARLSMGNVFGHLMERITSLRFTSAKEKHDHFYETYKDIYHRIPLGMVASYLGITQSTLSRLRSGK